MLLELVLPARPPLSFLTTLGEVHTLDFGPHCTNEILKHMQDEKVLPKLKHLAMARSVDVTDEGLAFLAKNPLRRRVLETLNLMYCRRTSHGATLDLTGALTALVFIRRQPEWMDGIRVYIGGTDTHWPDGPFLRLDDEGKMLSCGYWSDMHELETENRVVCKMEFAFGSLFNTERWQYPHRARYFYRTGHSFLHIPGNGSMLRAFPHKGLFPISEFPRPEHENTVPVGDIKAFTRQGEECALRDPRKYVWVTHQSSRRPLNEDMPPKDIVELCRTQVQAAANFYDGMDQAEAERQSHVQFGGDENDTPPPQWFQYYE